MILKSIVTSPAVTDEDTIYEKMIPSAIKKVKLTGKAKDSSKIVQYGKISKSLAISKAPKKISCVSKTKKEYEEFPIIANQLTKNLRCIATILFLGLLVLAIAIALAIYFAVMKKCGDDETNQESGATPSSLVRAPPIVPGLPQPDRSQCYIMSQWMPHFDFITYGEHAVKALGNFYAIKDEYFKNRKQMKEPALNSIIGESTKLVKMLSATVHEMHKNHYHSDFESDFFGEHVTRWVMCTKNHIANCNTHKDKLVKIMALYESCTKKMENMSIKIETAFRNFSNLVLQEPKLCPMGELLARYVKGFNAYFESLRTIVSALTIRLQQNINSTSIILAEKSKKQLSATNYKEYACLIIAVLALDDLSKPDEMLWVGEAQGKALLTYWEDRNVTGHFRVILDNLKNNSKTEEKIKEILEKWNIP